jgi:hypothetical protein
MSETDQRDHDGQLPLFPITPALLDIPNDAPALTAERRRTLRQRAMIERRVHPLAALGAHLTLHPEAAPIDLGLPGRRCGNCRFRELMNLGSARDFPKCTFPGSMTADQYARTGGPRVTRSAASDVRRWWPGCTDHEYGDPDLGPDAARYVPPDQPEG